MVSELHVPHLFINLMPPATSRRCLLPQDLDFSFGFFIGPERSGQNSAILEKKNWPNLGQNARTKI
jgi:hypothetical protein